MSTTVVKRTSLRLSYYRGNPAGYTEDLGIISDRNQWLPARPAGWYVVPSLSKRPEVFEWCKENLKSYREYRYNSHYAPDKVILDEKDAMLFQLRWT